MLEVVNFFRTNPVALFLPGIFIGKAGLFGERPEKTKLSGLSLFWLSIRLGFWRSLIFITSANRIKTKNNLSV